VGRKKKLLHFAENITFPHFFQPGFDEMKAGFELKGKWNEEFFGNEDPLVLELGCGKGEYTVGLAESNPRNNFIGVDIKGARLWKGAKDSVEKDLLNTAFLRIRVEDIVYCFDEDEVAEIWITFPDPQPRMKQVKKRLTSPRFLKIYRSLLKNGGILNLKTDNAEFYKFSLSMLPHFDFEIIYKTDNLYTSDWKGPASQFTTFYEQKFLDEGRIIKYIRAVLKKGRTSLKHQNEEDSFFNRVYEVVMQIPYGRVTSYGAIAAWLGSRGSARMVGWAMNASHGTEQPVPAHRVVNRNGVLTGKHHFGSPDLMRQLLESEGVEVYGDQIVNFEKYFWDPSKEIST